MKVIDELAALIWEASNDVSGHSLWAFEELDESWRDEYRAQVRSVLDANAADPEGLVLVRAGTGGVFPDGTTNHLWGLTVAASPSETQDEVAERVRRDPAYRQMLMEDARLASQQEDAAAVDFALRTPTYNLTDPEGWGTPDRPDNRP